MRNPTKFRLSVATALLAFASANSAYAAGFALIEMNASGQGNAYAGAAAYTNDASTIFFNPAGMMALEGEQLALAAHYIDPDADFDNAGSALAPGAGGGALIGSDDDGGQSAFVPNLYWVKPLDDKMSFGLGVNAPFGLKTDYDDDWVGRYHAILSDLRTVNFNPSLGYRVSDEISIGGGVNVMLADVELSSAIDFGILATTPQALDGEAVLEGDNYDDIGLGFNFGLTYAASDQTRIGLAYRSEVDIEVEGDADFTVPAAVAPGLPPNTFVDTGLEAEVTLPASFSVSVAHQVDKFTWLFDITWTGWESFDELRVEFDSAQDDNVTTEDWDDSLRYSLGFDYQYSDNLVLRAGIALDETPIPNAERRTPRVPGNDRRWLSFGASYMVDNKLSFDFGYSHLFIDDTRINNSLESATSAAFNATLTGEYEAEVDIFSAQLNWQIE